MLGMEDTHNPGYIAVILLTFIAFVISVLLTGFALAANADTGVVFSNSTPYLLELYAEGLNPAPWTHYVLWSVSLLGMLLWLCYGFSTIFRFTSYGYLYMAPGHMHPTIYVGAAVGLVSSSAWLFLIDYGYTVYALITIWLATIALYAATGISLIRLFKRGPVLQREDSSAEIWYVRILVQNGLDVFATWCFYLALVNTAGVIYESAVIGASSVLTIILSFLLAVIIGFLCVDLFVFDKYSRYCCGAYVVYLLGLIGTLDGMGHHKSPTFTLTAFTLAAAALALIAKVTVMIWRHFTVQIWTGSSFFVTHNKNYGTIDLFKEPSETTESNVY